MSIIRLALIASALLAHSAFAADTARIVMLYHGKQPPVQFLQQVKVQEFVMVSVETDSPDVDAFRITLEYVDTAGVTRQQVKTVDRYRGPWMTATSESFFVSGYVRGKAKVVAMRFSGPESSLDSQ